MTLAKALQVAAGNSQESADVAEAIDFDGTNDYLSRASDFTGNTDGKTFTFSAWVWVTQTGTSSLNYYVANNLGNATCNFYYDATAFSAILKATGNVTVLDVSNSVNLPVNTWSNILVSIDLSNTANRFIYLNDVNITSTATWTTYSNTDIDRAGTGYSHYVAGRGAAYAKGRLSNVFLDYTYRDLSVTANRRLFVTADLKPADGQAALNPILYLPMNDPTAPGVNAGTGGNFTLTGNVARSGRGPNQYNAPYSDLDGSADFLSRTTAPTGIANGKQFTISYVAQPDTTGENYIFTIATSTTNRFYIAGNSGAIQIRATNSSGTVILLAESASAQYVPNRNVVVTISIDLTDTSKRHFYVNGVAISVVWVTYTNDNIQFNVTSTPTYRVGCDSSTTEFNGRLGAVWFNTSYIDLSSADNLAKFVTGTGIDAKPVDLGASGELPTGTAPIIYLPMYGNNAGKNYGTGGDFTVNSGPYTGARGPNEFWGNKAVFNGSSSRISRGTMSGVSASATVSGCFWLRIASYPSTQALVLYGDYGLRIGVTTTSSQPLTFTATNSSTNIILSLQINTTTFGTGTYYCVQYCFDMNNSSKRFVYVNGVSQSLIISTYTSGNIAHNLMAPIIGWNGGSGYLNGGIAEMYMTTDYIDFSQEANRLKFRDAFGNPVNLTQQIEDAAIPNPAIYMRFPPTSFGTNSGTGGAFTATSITDGGQL